MTEPETERRAQGKTGPFPSSASDPTRKRFAVDEAEKSSDTLAQLESAEAQEAVAANLAFGHPGAGRPDDPGADVLEDQRTIANLHGS